MEPRIPPDMRRDRRPGAAHEKNQVILEKPRSKLFTLGKLVIALSLMGSTYSAYNLYSKHAKSTNSSPQKQIGQIAAKSPPVNVKVNQGDEPLIQKASLPTRTQARQIVNAKAIENDSQYRLINRHREPKTGAVCFSIREDYAQALLAKPKKYDGKYGRTYTFTGLIRVESTDELIDRFESGECEWAIIKHDATNEFYSKFPIEKTFGTTLDIDAYEAVRLMKAAAKRECDTTRAEKACATADWTPYVPPEVKYEKWKSSYVHESGKAMLTLMNIERFIPGAAGSCRNEINQNISTFADRSNMQPKDKLLALEFFRGAYVRCSGFVLQLCDRWQSQSRDVERACRIYESERDRNFKVHG